MLKKSDYGYDLTLSSDTPTEDEEDVEVDDDAEEEVERIDQYYSYEDMREVRPEVHPSADPHARNIDREMAAAMAKQMSSASKTSAPPVDVESLEKVPLKGHPGCRNDEDCIGAPSDDLIQHIKSTSNETEVVGDAYCTTCWEARMPAG